MHARHFLTACSFLTLVLGLSAAAAEDVPRSSATLPYPIVDTAQVRTFDAHRETKYPAPGKAYFGQDAHYAGNDPRYKDLGDGTVLDLVTRLMWQKTAGAKGTYAQLKAAASRCRTGGHKDWRLPTIKELYSLILFSGRDLDPMSAAVGDATPFLDTKVFDFAYGDRSKGERLIDSQWATSTEYVHTTMRGDKTLFGVNFADGRIKGYGLRSPRGGDKTFFARYVRGNADYGRNDFVDNKDGTVTDRATGLIWMKQDSGHLKAGTSKDGRMDWPTALAWAENLKHAGHDDWRLPNAKELQSIVDYTRSPATTRSAAIDPVFEASPVKAADGSKDYGFYWSSTTHASVRAADAAVYVAFGRSNGWMHGQLLDAHGAGSQRSDPKTGDASKFPQGRGPQGDVVRILNVVRCVRGGVAKPRRSGPAVRAQPKGEARPRGGARPKGPPGGGGEAWVKRLDRNGDNKVSREEFDGPAQHFGDFDRDGDGFIEADEAPRGPPRGGPPGRRKGR